MTLEKRFPTLFSQPHAREWLLEKASDLASNTVSAYGHALVDYFRFCAIRAINPPDAKRTDVRAYVTDLKSRSKFGMPARRPGYVKSTTHDGFANATIRLRVTTVRLYYEYLIDEEVRTTNPIKIVKYKRGRGFNGNSRGMVERYEKDPWLPNETQWQALLNAASSECIRNRFMLALAYDTGVRRAELCALETGDIDPSQRLLHLRAKTTKSQRARQVPYSQATGELYAAYLQHRRRISRAPGPLFLSESRRNKGLPISFWTWSKVVKALGERAGLPLFTPHTLRHLRLTDLAQAGWKMAEIAALAGHVHPATTMIYVHISGRELSERFRQTLDSTLDWRQETMQTSLQ
ncbi:site-specific integrase [Hymenobacter nivis]|uniref:Site-specific integrase n=2 Tax=Hymenobacter nivis TaxID=1850093 RepID=A0A502GBC1_9BACT|nr:site-specific integrase [Hymenobacter nivis]